jgi:hypothetical protein
MMRSRGWLLGAAASLALVALDAERGAAELFRCTGPDGKTVFTDDKSVCPNADQYQPKGEVHRGGPRPAALSADGGESDPRQERATRREQALSAQSGEQARWQQLKASKENELQDVIAQRGRLVEYVSWCNRGGSVIRRDDAGIAQGVKCNELNTRLAELDGEADRLREYLSSGLEEECRQAGCEPGWIR